MKQYFVFLINTFIYQVSQFAVPSNTGGKQNILDTVLGRSIYKFLPMKDYHCCVAETYLPPMSSFCG